MRGSTLAAAKSLEYCFSIGSRADGGLAFRHRVRTLMCEADLRTTWKRSFVSTTDSKHTLPVAENVLDLHSRKVVGWSMAPTMPAGLVTSALAMALQQRQPAPGLVLHSDRGSQLRFKESLLSALPRRHEYERVIALNGDTSNEDLMPIRVDDRLNGHRISLGQHAEVIVECDGSIEHMLAS
jgi:hypothetical protein